MSHLPLLLMFPLALSTALAQVASAASATQFEFDLVSGAGSGPSKNFLSLRGGAPRFTMIHYRTGQGRDTRKSTEDPSYDEDFVACPDVDGDPSLRTHCVGFDDLRLLTPFVGGQTGNLEDIKNIVNFWAEGTSTPWDSALTIKDRENNNIRTISYLHNLPVNFNLPPVGSGPPRVLAFGINLNPAAVRHRSASLADSGIAGSSHLPDIDWVATSHYFSFEIDGQPADRMRSVDPGAVEFEFAPADTSAGSRQTNEKEFTADKVTYRPWRVERFYRCRGDHRLNRGRGNSDWFRLFKQFRDSRSGPGRPALPVDGSLTYFDKNQIPVLTVNFYDAAVISYEPGHDVDAQSGEACLTETLHFEVNRVELR